MIKLGCIVRRTASLISLSLEGRGSSPGAGWAAVELFALFLTIGNIFLCIISDLPLHEVFIISPLYFPFCFLFFLVALYWINRLAISSNSPCIFRFALKFYYLLCIPSPFAFQSPIYLAIPSPNNIAIPSPINIAISYLSYNPPPFSIAISYLSCNPPSHLHCNLQFILLSLSH